MKNVFYKDKLLGFKKLLCFVVISFFFVSSARAIPPVQPPVTLVNPPVNPDRGTGPSTHFRNFDWQKEWGSIHMNSWIDGLSDPGSTSTTNIANRLPCVEGTVCQNAGGIKPFDSAEVRHGIKFDIKNSLLACLSEAIPQWPIENYWYPNGINGVCKDSLKMHKSEYWNPKGGGTNANPNGSATGPYTGHAANIKTAYMPIWDSRSNDSRYHQSGGFVGCQQQIANGCYRDIHECVSSQTFSSAPANQPIPRTSDGYKFPVSHIFTKEEKDQLNASSLNGPITKVPTKYFRYTRDDSPPLPDPAPTPLPDPILTPGVLSVRDPRLSANADLKMAAGTEVEEIDTTENNYLTNLKTYRLQSHNEHIGASEDFIIVDSIFFDLQQYATNFGYGAGTLPNFVSSDGTTATLPESKNKYAEIPKNSGIQRLVPDQACPATRLTGGYSGICDPIPVSEGGAGCNLPIYHEGAETSIDAVDGTNFRNRKHEIRWSGYVQKWAVLTVAQYNQNIAGREILYLDGNKLNNNPILMFTRANEYCDPLERTSASKLNAVLGWNPDDFDISPDMPCVQYVQYQKTGTDGTHAFVDLFNPSENAFRRYEPAYTLMQLYHLDANGKPDPSRPIAGTGDDRYISPPGYNDHSPGGAGNVYLSMKDRTAKVLDANGNPIKDAKGDDILAVQVADYNGDFYLDPTTGSQSGAMMGTDGMKTIGSYLKVEASGSSSSVNKDMGIAVVLKPGTALAVRRQGADMDKWLLINGRPASCYVMVYEPEAKEELFVPTMEHDALQSFIDSASKGNVPNLFVRACTAHYFVKGEDDPADTTDKARRKYSGGIVAKDASGREILNSLGVPVTVTGGLNSAKTDLNVNLETWVGTLSCNNMQGGRPACNQTKMISAYRYCRLENGSVGSCEECDGILPQNDPDHALLQSMLSRNDEQSVGFAGKVLVNPLVANVGKCYISISCFNKSGAGSGCPSAGTSGGHVFCFAPNTKIEMADGNKKAIKDIKPGEVVVAFSAKNSKSASLGKSKVLATAVTEKQMVLQINSTKLTGAHKIVLESGRSVRADEIKVGDKMLRADNSIETVTKVETNLKPITVYNLILEEGWDGYIADGLRVMSYPLLQEMEN